MEPEVKADALPSLQDLPASEYRQVREGKSLADVVAARSEAHEAQTDDEASGQGDGGSHRQGQGSTDAGMDGAIQKGNQPQRDETGKFTKPAEAPPKAGNPRHDPKARVDELKAEIADLAKQKGETKAERDAIAAELATLRAEREALRTPQKPAERPQAAPQAEKFPDYDVWLTDHPDESYDAYIDARADFRYDQREKVKHAAEAEKAEQAKQAETWKPFREREAAFKAQTPDYDLVIQRSPVAAMPLPPWVIEEVASNDQGPALRYHLAQHPDETQWIASLPKAAAVRHLQSILSATAASTVTAAPAPQSKADPPFETVGVSPSAASTSLETVAARGSAADYRRVRERMRP